MSVYCLLCVLLLSSCIESMYMDGPFRLAQAGNVVVCGIDLCNILIPVK